MMAGISSANSGDDVCILEKNEKLGRKLLITGKGRCNITSSLEMKDFIANVPGNGRFLYSCFENFTNQDIIAMLKKQGVAVKEERGNRIFPVSDKSMDVLRAFEKELNEKHVKIKFNANVTEIETKENKVTGVEYIDEFGKKAVNSVLDAEYERVLVSHPRKPRLRKLGIDFYDFPASAGTGNFLESELPEKIWVNESSEAEQADFVIPISGDSMEPTFHSGDRVFVVKDDALEEGDIGIFIVNGDAYIKEFGNKCLISHNTAYKPLQLLSSDSIYCCGRVIGVVEE